MIDVPLTTLLYLLSAFNQQFIKDGITKMSLVYTRDTAKNQYNLHFS